MPVSPATLQRAVDMAHTLEAEGYFAKVAEGDQRAAALFVQLVAHRLNPSARGSDYGRLTKQPGETQVDGFAEDAVCYGNNPGDLANAVDLVNGAGAEGASVGGAVKERRPENKWSAPLPLTDAELAYLKDTPVVVVPPFPPRDETLRFAVVLNGEYSRRGAPQNGTLGGRLDQPTPVARCTDYEGEIIWTSEYLRRRQLGESDAEATAHVLQDVAAAWPK